MSAPEIRREGRLGDGMVIGAKVGARLFGWKILTLDADVTIAPTPPRLTVRRPPERDERRRALPAPTTNGAIGGGLDAAARSLEASAAELSAARRQMP